MLATLGNELEHYAKCQIVQSSNDLKKMDSSFHNMMHPVNLAAQNTFTYLKFNSFRHHFYIFSTYPTTRKYCNKKFLDRPCKIGGAPSYWNQIFLFGISACPSPTIPVHTHWLFLDVDWGLPASYVDFLSFAH